MIDKRLCIVNSNILFEILSELIKESSFELIFKNANDLNEKDFKSQNIIYLMN